MGCSRAEKRKALEHPNHAAAWHILIRSTFESCRRMTPVKAFQSPQAPKAEHVMFHVNFDPVAPTLAELAPRGPIGHVGASVDPLVPNVAIDLITQLVNQGDKSSAVTVVGGTFNQTRQGCFIVGKNYQVAAGAKLAPNFQSEKNCEALKLEDGVAAVRFMIPRTLSLAHLLKNPSMLPISLMRIPPSPVFPSSLEASTYK